MSLFDTMCADGRTLFFTCVFPEWMISSSKLRAKQLDKRRFFANWKPRPSTKSPVFLSNMFALKQLYYITTIVFLTTLVNASPLLPLPPNSDCEFPVNGMCALQNKSKGLEY